MRLKRVISFLLLAFYVSASAGPALVSLTCGCKAPNTHTAYHTGCRGCAHHDDRHDHDHASTAGEQLESTCCNDHHSIEIALYTGFSADDAEKEFRCAVVDLPPALLAHAPAIADTPICLRKAAERRVPLIAGDYFASAGLRAPPVLA